MRRLFTAFIVAGAIIPAVALANPSEANNGGTLAKTEVAPKKKTEPKAWCASLNCRRRVYLKKHPYPKRYKTWIAIGRCEQPGPGKFGINWSHPGPTYGGGLGIYIGTWRGFAPKGFPSTPGQATWRQQMTVANRIYARYGGTHPWGCGR